MSTVTGPSFRIQCFLLTFTVIVLLVVVISRVDLSLLEVLGVVERDSSHPFEIIAGFCGRKKSGVKT